MSIKVWDPTTLNYVLKDPPDYGPDDELWIYYDVENFSCQDVSVSVALTGSVSKSRIHDAADPGDACLTECTIDSASSVESGWYGGVVKWDLAAHPAGQYALRIVATTPDETLTDDNEIEIPVTLRDPVVDVRLSAVVPSQTTAIIGQTITFEVSVSNAGESSVEPTVGLFVDDTDSPVETVQSPAIAPGGVKELILPWDTSGTSAGNHSVRIAALVPDNTAADAAERRVEVRLHNPVDLAITSALVMSENTYHGDQIPVAVTVANTSDFDADASSVALHIRGEASPVATGSIPLIGSHSSETVELRWDTSGLATGQYDLSATVQGCCDPNETNNSASLKVILRNAIELIDIAPTESNGVVGDPIEYTARIGNEGERTAEDVTVSLYELGDTLALANPESTEAMGRVDDTRDDGQGKVNGPGLIPIEGMRVA